MAMPKLYAFWKYSDFPFVCGGTVTEMNVDGRVQTEEHGKGHWWTPIKILPAEQGAGLHQTLRELDLQMKNEITNIKLRYRQQLLRMIPEAVDK